MIENMLSKEESEALREQGANAFAQNVFHARNPLYRAENMPSRTGEDIKIWRAKVNAWEAGYATEKLNKKS